MGNFTRDCKREIIKAGRVTPKIQEMFFDGKDFCQIREWLAENGLDRHMPIDLRSVEVALVTPLGVMMQIRPSDNNKLGLLGGVLEKDETPIEGAIRELLEETGIVVEEKRLKFIEESPHIHKYGNGDVANFKTYRFRVWLDHIPEITLDQEAAGTIMVNLTNIDKINILDHQREFVEWILGKK